MQTFVGQLLLVPYNFAPSGYMFCQGQLLSISDYNTLFVLIGTTFGGDGQNTFALPDLRGRAAIGIGQGPGLSNYNLGQAGGVENVTLTGTQMPVHQHAPGAAGANGNSGHPGGALLGDGTGIYHTGAGGAAMSAATIGQIGGSQPHTNLQPVLTMNWCISLFGIFPSQN